MAPNRLAEPDQETRQRFVGLFEPLSEAEFENLKADIERHGVLVPILVDEQGTIIDGHHRKRAADELGIRCPQLKKTFRDEDDRRAHAIAANLLRRHLPKPKRQEWIWEWEQLVLDVSVPRTLKPKAEPHKASKPDTTATERQRRHRLREMMRPKVVASGFDDPWELAAEALKSLHRMRSIRDPSALLAEIEECEELVRRLAWGPED